MLLFSGLILYMRLSESILSRVKVSRISPLQLGEKVPPFGTRVVYPEYQRAEIGGEDKIRLLLIYSPLCGSCRQTWPVWREIAEAGNIRDIEVLALSTLPEDITLKHAREQNIPVPVGLFPHGSETEAYRLTVLPVTLFLDGNQVIGYWSGVLEPEQQKEIYKAMLKVLIRRVLQTNFYEPAGFNQHARDSHRLDDASLSTNR